MAEQTHRIERQILEIEVSDPSEGRRLQEVLSRLHRQSFAGIIERTLDELAGPGTLVRIDRLTIDLGEIDDDRIEAAFAQSLRRELRAGLERALRSDDAGAPRPRQVDGPAAAVHEIAYFARTGALPWSAAARDARHLSQRLQEALQGSPRTLTQALRELAQEPPALARLAAHYGDAELASLVDLLLAPYRLRPVGGGGGASAASLELRELIDSAEDLPGRTSAQRRNLAWSGLLVASAGHRSGVTVSPAELYEAAFDELSRTTGRPLTTARERARTLQRRAGLSDREGPRQPTPGTTQPPEPPESANTPEAPREPGRDAVHAAALRLAAASGFAVEGPARADGASQELDAPSSHDAAKRPLTAPPSGAEDPSSNREDGPESRDHRAATAHAGRQPDDTDLGASTPPIEADGVGDPGGDPGAARGEREGPLHPSKDPSSSSSERAPAPSYDKLLRTGSGTDPGTDPGTDSGAGPESHPPAGTEGAGPSEPDIIHGTGSEPDPATTHEGAAPRPREGAGEPPADDPRVDARDRRLIDAIRRWSDVADKAASLIERPGGGMAGAPGGQARPQAKRELERLSEALVALGDAVETVPEARLDALFEHPAVDLPEQPGSIQLSLMALAGRAAPKLSREAAAALGRSLGRALERRRTQSRNLDGGGSSTSSAGKDPSAPRSPTAASIPPRPGRAERPEASAPSPTSPALTRARPPLRPRSPRPRLPRAKSRERAFIDSDRLHVDDAGLVILWPFLPHLFGHLDLLDGRSFRDSSAQLRAAALLRVAAAGEEELAEYQLPLAKLLCGLEVDALYELDTPLTEPEIEECSRMLEALIARATILKEMSIGGLRGSFLLRPGVIAVRDGGWFLRVERRAYDLVLARFPWTFEWVKLPWMGAPIQVEW